MARDIRCWRVFLVEGMAKRICGMNEYKVGNFTVMTTGKAVCIHVK